MYVTNHGFVCKGGGTYTAVATTLLQLNTNNPDAGSSHGILATSATTDLAAGHGCKKAVIKVVSGSVNLAIPNAVDIANSRNASATRGYPLDAGDVFEVFGENDITNTQLYVTADAVVKIILFAEELGS
jgi:hypothetical protein